MTMSPISAVNWFMNYTGWTATNKKFSAIILGIMGNLHSIFQSHNAPNYICRHVGLCSRRWVSEILQYFFVIYYPHVELSEAISLYTVSHHYIMPVTRLSWICSQCTTRLYFCLCVWNMYKFMCSSGIATLGIAIIHWV